MREKSKKTRRIPDWCELLGAIVVFAVLMVQFFTATLFPVSIATRIQLFFAPIGVCVLVIFSVVYWKEIRAFFPALYTQTWWHDREYRFNPIVLFAILIGSVALFVFAASSQTIFGMLTLVLLFAFTFSITTVFIGQYDRNELQKTQDAMVASLRSAMSFGVLATNKSDIDPNILPDDLTPEQLASVAATYMSGLRKDFDRFMVELSCMDALPQSPEIIVIPSCLDTHQHEQGRDMSIQKVMTALRNANCQAGIMSATIAGLSQEMEWLKIELLQAKLKEVEFIWNTRPEGNVDQKDTAELRGAAKAQMTALREHREELVRAFIKRAKELGIPVMDAIGDADLSAAFRSVVQQMLNEGKLIARPSGEQLHPSANALIAYALVPQVKGE